MSTWVSSGLRDARRGRRAANYTWRAVRGARCTGRLGHGWDRRLAPVTLPALLAACSSAGWVPTQPPAAAAAAAAAAATVAAAAATTSTTTASTTSTTSATSTTTTTTPRLLPLLHERAYHLVRVGAQGGHDLGGGGGLGCGLGLGVGAGARVMVGITARIGARDWVRVWGEGLG